MFGSVKKILFSITLLIVLLLSGLYGQGKEFEGNKKAVLYLSTTAPVIDGQFEEWQALEGVTTRVAVYGGGHFPEDAEGFFVYWSDNKRLYIYAKVVDDTPNENGLPAPIAWRNDSIEVYIGIQTNVHSSYLRDDSRMRFVPVSKSDPKSFRVSINDKPVNSGIDAAIVFNDTGYTIEASVPLQMLNIRGFTLGQAFRAEFQVNDGDDTERDRLIHWKSPYDNTYHNPSGWGDAIVVAHPQAQ